MNLNQEHAMWMEIVQRLEAGEMQSEVARAYGMSRGKFRYRLAKFLEVMGELGMEEVAAARMSDGEERAQAMMANRPDLDIPLVDHSLRDASLINEAWHRQHGLNRLVAMVKEPRTLFAYWEVNEPRKQLIMEHFQSDWNHLPFYLVVQDVTDLQFNGSNAHDTILIEVHPRAESWYIHGVTPGRRYLIDFCTTTLGGQRFAILRSNIVETPPLLEGNRLEPQLMFSTVHQETPEFLQAKDAELVPMSLQEEPWHDLFTGYNLAENTISGEGDKH